MKTCGQCKESKPKDAFYKRTASIDGLAACCKKCQWIYDCKRLNAPHRVAARAAYGKDPVEAARRQAAQDTWLKRNAEKRKAHCAVNNAVRDGRLIKPDTCSRCGSGGRICGHHDDYSKPLDVIWLCDPCHKEEHLVEYRHRQMIKYEAGVIING